MSKLLGIDLGTTFSAMATIDESGRAKILNNQEGEAITASCCEYLIDEKRIIVGTEAHKNIGKDNVFYRFKMDMGSNKKIIVNDEIFTPKKLSSLILKKLYQDAQHAIGKIEESVITVPANFSNEAREDTMQAAKLAGLKVKYIINEPTAAAVYYALEENLEDGNYIVFDLGGGTFDVTALNLKEMNVEILTSNGISKLGGRDFDDLLCNFVRKKYNELTGNNLKESAYTINDAEIDKKTLSNKENTYASSIRDIDVPISRKEFNNLLLEFISQIEMLCESTLIEANLTTESLKGVLLVGGSSRIPIIQETVKQVFKMNFISTANLDQVVGLGAAIYAGYKANKDGNIELSAAQRNTLNKINLYEVTNKCFGTVALFDNKRENSIIIKKNTKIPISETKAYTTVDDGQTEVNCIVTESGEETNDLSFVKIISESILNLPGGRPKGQKIDVTYKFDENQIMHCSFHDIESGKRSEVNLKLTESKTSKEKESIDDINDFIIE